MYSSVERSSTLVGDFNKQLLMETDTMFGVLLIICLGVIAELCNYNMTWN